MESRNDFATEETLDPSDAGQKDATETERRSVVEPKVPTATNASRVESRSANALRESVEENKGIFQETNATGSHSEGVDGSASARENKSAGASEENAMTARQVTSADDTRRDSPRRGKTGARRRQRPFCDIIGKREQRRDELEKVEGDLRQRLDVLECSMPAVMAWNVWRMTQGVSACGIKRILEKHFKAASELPARGTPSCHYDCRVREVEAERKLALKKVEEARVVWAEKIRALGERRREVEEARKVQVEQRSAMEQLNKELEMLQEAMEKAEAEDESCLQGECGDERCGRRRLAKASSATSIESGDIECLEKLQQLAEEELTMKKDIAELERREDAYMRTLQQAGELWSKVEEDAVSSASVLQEQLEMKTAANQQLAGRVCELEDSLEKCRTRMVACRTELEKFLSIEKLEAAIGRDDDVAQVTDREVAVRAKVTHRPVGRPNDVATVKDDGVLATVEAADADAEAISLGDDKYVTVSPETADLAVDRQVDLAPIEEEKVEEGESAVRPEDYEQLEIQEVKRYLAQLGSLEELYEDDGEPCPPDFACNDVVTSPIGMTDEELMGLDPTAAQEARKIAARKELRRERVAKITDDEAERSPPVETEREAVGEIEERAVDDGPITRPEAKRFDAENVVIKRDEILSWISRIDTTRTEMTRYPELQAVKKEADILAEEIGAHVGIKPKEVVVDKAVAKHDEDKIKYVPEVRADLPKIHITEQPQVKPVTLPDVITEPTEVDIEQVESEDKSTVSEEKEVKLESKIPSVVPPNLYFEEAPAKADLTREEISAEPSEGVSIEAPQVQQIKKNDVIMKAADKEMLVEQAIPKKEEKIIFKDAERIEEDTRPEIKESPFTQFKETAKVDLKEEITADVKPPKMTKPIEPFEAQHIDDKAIKPADKEPLTVQKIDRKEEEKIIFKDAEKILEDTRPEIKESPVTHFKEAAKVDLKEEITADVKPPKVTKPIEPFEVQHIDDKAIKPADKEPLTVQKIDRKEEEIIPTKIKIEMKEVPREEVTEQKAVPRVEITEIEEVPGITIQKEETKAEEIVPTVDVKKAEKLMADEISPRVDLIEIEEPKPSKLPIIELPITEAPIVETSIAEVPIVEAPIAEAPIVEAPIAKVEEIEEPELQVEITKEEDQEIEKVTVEEIIPPKHVEEEKELPPTRKEEPIEAPAEPTPAEVEREEVPPPTEKFYMFETFDAKKKILIVKVKSTKAIPAEPRYVLDGRMNFEERQFLHVTEATKPLPTVFSADRSVTSRASTSLVEESTTMEEEITGRSGVLVQSELITEAELSAATGVGTPTTRIAGEYFKPAVPKASTSSDRPEITGQKMPWRLKDQSTVTTASAGSQTDKTGRVSHDRVERERARLATDELLRSIKIAARLTRGDTEREIRTINYGARSDDEAATKPAACNCCLCGEAASSFTTARTTRLPVHQQLDSARTTKSPLAAAFKRAFLPPKIDRTIPYDRLCPDCKVRIQGRIKRDKQSTEKTVAKMSQAREDRSTGTTKPSSCRTAPRKRTIEKKDQCCLAKISKRNAAEVTRQKRKCDPPALSEKRTTAIEEETTAKTDSQPLTPSCICFQLEKPNVGPARKGNCYCAD